MSSVEKKNEQEHIHLLSYKTSNQEVSQCSRAKRPQRNVQKSVYLPIRPIDLFGILDAIAI